MDRLMTVLAGVSVSLFCGLILSQFHYESLSFETTKERGNDPSLYGKDGTYQDQSKSGKAQGLTKEAMTGNTD